MKNRKRKKQEQKDTQQEMIFLSEHFKLRLKEGFLILLFILSIFLLFSMFTYHRNDPSWSNDVMTSSISNGGGKVGAYIADVLFNFFGYVAYIFPLLSFYGLWIFYKNKNKDVKKPQGLLILRLLGFCLMILSACAVFNLYFGFHFGLPIPASGGIVGDLFLQPFMSGFNRLGSSLLLLALLLMGITLMTGFSWFSGMESLGKAVLNVRFGKFKKSANPIEMKVEPGIAAEGSVKLKIKKVDDGISKEKEIKIYNKIEKSEKEIVYENPHFSTDPSVLPKLSLLDQTVIEEGTRYSEDELKIKSAEVEMRLADFGIQAQVVAVHPGPVVTRYELQLAAGTKVNRITALAKDLARSLSVISVRVVEVIPGKSVIGIELPNPQREIVRLSTVLASSAYQHARSPLSLALGKDIAGHPVVVDLRKMPHLLLAGTTGSGKSVSLNAILMSLLYKSTIKELRMILIDPKMLELSIYADIPHLLTPVVTDMRDAAAALRWAVIEMERRYRLMAALGVRNIMGYNAKIEEANKKEKPIVDPFSKEQNEYLTDLPNIVIVADEYADMMAVVGKKIEVLIARLAQKARAAGVHLILATQRPSVDVITGLIKANIPTRIAFQVSSKIDSRTILDQQGAEQLLGHGDMLYLAPGTGLPVRIHGVYVSDEEVHQVTDYLRQHSTPQYLENILNDININADENFDPNKIGLENNNAEESDPLYDQAVEMVLQSRRVSISSIQRRFKIGYNRAARIVEAMETAGVVSAMDRAGNRDVLAQALEQNV